MEGLWMLMVKVMCGMIIHEDGKGNVWNDCG